MSNTAPILGVSTRHEVAVLYVTDWGLDPDSFHDVSAEAACAGNDTTVATLEGCAAVVGATTPHGGAVAVWAAWAGLSARLTLQVWRPSTLTLGEIQSLAAAIHADRVR